MNKENWQLATNLKTMLREGKTTLEITNKKSHNEVFSDRISNIIAEHMNGLTIMEIYHVILNMDIQDSTDYNKITAELFKRFSGESVTVKITIPEKTIQKYHINYTSEEKPSDGTILLVVCGVILLAISAFLYFL